MSRVPAFFKLSVLILIAGVAFSGRAQADLETGARAFIEDLAKHAVEQLAAKDISREERIKRFRDLFQAKFLVRPIGRAALGRIVRSRAWKNASDDLKASYFKVFESYVVNTYVDLFARYAGEQLKISDSRTENEQFLTVFSTLQRPGGAKPIRINWQVATNGKVFKVYDIFGEGSSMTSTFAVNLRSIYGREGRTMENLVAGMEKEIARINAQQAKE